MTLPTILTLESSLLALPLVGDSTWTDNIASWVASSTDIIMWLTGILPTANTVFTFNQAVFKSNLLALTPTSDSAAGASAFFNALETAILASAYLVSPGAYLGSPGAATTWSAVTSTIPDPVSLVVAKTAAVSYMSTAPLSGTKPTMATAVYRYLTSLTYTVTGLNSTVPPTPLVAALVAVI